MNSLGKMASLIRHLMLLVLVLALPACDSKSNTKARSDAARPVPPRPVKTAAVELQPMERTVKVVGSLLAQDDTTLSAKVPGRLESIAVDLGTVVKKGQLIAQLERRDYELQLKQAEALLAQSRVRLGLPLDGPDDRVELENTSTVKQAKALLDEALKNRDRIAKLREKGIISQSELETAEAGYQVAYNKYRDSLEEIRNRQALFAQRRAEVEIARQQLTDAVIQAPYDAVVQEKHASVGEYLIIGKQIVTVVQVDPLRLRVEVPEREAPRVRLGQKVRLKLEGDTQVHHGVIKRLSPVINEQNRMLVAEADIPNNGTLRPGAFARAEIVVVEKEPVLAVPQAAVAVFVGIEKIFLAKDGKVVERLVTTGRRTDGKVEILSGVKSGDAAILNPVNLQSGQPVIIEK